MALADDAALRNLMNFLPALQQSPDKLTGLDDIMQSIVKTMPNFGEMPELNIQSDISSKPTASSSSGSTSPNEEGTEGTDDSEAAMEVPTAPSTTIIPRQYRMEPWHECFQTTKQNEFEALIYSVYVISKDQGKLDGYEYYECINRLQSKCRYKVRTKKVSEFYVVEEKGAHNHAMEPVGSPGSHAGLPKTLREIVDTSFHKDWPNTLRQQKIDEEVKRLGLPHNPRLGRQIDNRIAYLRRVKNLSDMKKFQDQLPPGAVPPMPPAAALEGGDPSEILRILMQHMGQNTAENTPQQDQNGFPQVILPQQPLVFHDSNNELTNLLNQAQKDGGQGAVLQMLVDAGHLQQMALQPQQAQQREQQLQDSSCSTPEGRLQIEDQ